MAWRVVDERAVGRLPAFEDGWSQVGRVLVDVSRSSAAVWGWRVGDRLALEMPQVGEQYEPTIDRVDDGPGQSRSVRASAVDVDGRSRRVVLTVGPLPGWDRLRGDWSMDLRQPARGRCGAGGAPLGTSWRRSPGRSVRVEIPAGATRTLTAADLEGGTGGGALGDGRGKWRLRVTSSGPLAVTSLLASPEGHLTSLSAEPSASLAANGVHTVPLFPSAADAHGRQGFVRIANRSRHGADVVVRPYDDAGRRYAPLTLALDPAQTVHFDSDDLELGNAEKGLTGSTGSGTGDWRLEFRSDADIQVLAYVRTPTGFLTTMHEVVERRGRRHDVATFNPASNLNQTSKLRIVNVGSRPAHVSIASVDDRGASPGDVVQLTIAAGTAHTLTAGQLERGDHGQQGAIGDGVGKWRLLVDCEQPILVMNLLESRTGRLTNLSTSPNGSDAGRW